VLTTLTLGRIFAGLVAFVFMCWYLSRRFHRTYIANCIKRQLS
jgi:hypothetical protein